MNPAFQATVAFAPDCSSASDSAAPSWLQRLLGTFREVPEDVRDRSTGLYNRAGFFAAADDAMRMRMPGTPVSVVVLEVDDLREVYQIYGSAVARKVAAKLVRRLRALGGWRGLVGRTGSAQFAVVLVGMTHDKALRAVQRTLGKPARVEFDAGDSEIVLVPDLLVDAADAGAESVQPVYREMAEELARVRKEERRRLDFLTSERERHSRPMHLPR